MIQNHSLKLLAFILTTTSFSSIEAMEMSAGKEDKHHDLVFSRMLKDHNLPPHDLREVKIFDINEAHAARSEEIHQASLKRARGPQASSSWLYSGITYPFRLIGGLVQYVPGFRSSPVAPQPTHLTNVDKHEFVLVENPTKPKNIPSDESNGDSCPSKMPKYLVLSMNGGGLRGRLGAYWLDRLNQFTKQPTWKVFDQIGGTSTGGLKALSVSMSLDGINPVKSEAELLEMMRHEGPTIFPEKAWWNIPSKLSSYYYNEYDPGPYEKFLQRDLGDTLYGSALTPTIVTTVKPIDNTIFILNSQKHPLCKAWQVGRSTSAAPTYFPAFTLKDGLLAPVEVVDGGVGVNDPALETLLALKERVEPLQSMPFHFDQVTLFSFGTGKMPVASLLPGNAGALRAAAPVVEMAMSTQVSGMHDTMTDILTKGNYFYLNPELKTPIPMDRLTNEQARELDDAADAEWGKNQESIETNEVLRRRLESLQK
ncbi:MAG: patatin-like phospholipase family protein [Alphaproteobacteria bacterium]|jgi:hypothetical protein|nr:patatin-like phospholipase family protein [Alphaproteobacteria bacterium]